MRMPSQGTVIVCGDNVCDESQMIPTLLRAEKIMEEIPLPAGIEMKQILDNSFHQRISGMHCSF
jgi:hypothetical protein